MSPTGRLERRPYACGHARGLCYGEVPDELARVLPHFLERRPVPEAEALKEGSVYRWRDWVVKLPDEVRGLRGRLRPSQARRAAELAYRMRAVRTPRPLLAVTERGGGGAQSLLVLEFIAGRHLDEVQDAAAWEALAAFLARMHDAGVYHADLHPANVIWDGREWVLIDLLGLRGGLHRLFARKLVERQWTRLVHYLTYADPGAIGRLRDAFERYVAQRGARGPAEAAWTRVCRGASRLRAQAGMPDIPRGAPSCP